MSDDRTTNAPVAPDHREQPGRYQRSPAGMAGALLVTLLVIFAFVAFRACNRTGLEVSSQRVDYLAQIGFAQQAGDHLVYPASLPRGWYATHMSVSPGHPDGLELSVLTPDDRYAGLVQSPDSVSALLIRYVDTNPAQVGTVRVPGAVDGTVERWDVWTDSGGDTALVARHHGATLLVFGSASRSELEQFTASLTTARLTR
jgi:Protein of unknown function (DUF4245)